jgi:hypothetical protein
MIGLKRTRVNNLLTNYSGSNENRLVSLESGHAIQFEKPEAVATEIINFVRQRNERAQRPAVLTPSAEVDF